MSKNRYLYEDVRDLKQAWNDLIQPLLKPIVRMDTWLLDRLSKWL